MNCSGLHSQDYVQKNNECCCMPAVREDEGKLLGRQATKFYVSFASTALLFSNSYDRMQVMHLWKRGNYHKARCSSQRGARSRKGVRVLCNDGWLRSTITFTGYDNFYCYSTSQSCWTLTFRVRLPTCMSHSFHPSSSPRHCLRPWCCDCTVPVPSGALPVDYVIQWTSLSLPAYFETKFWSATRSTLAHGQGLVVAFHWGICN